MSRSEGHGEADAGGEPRGRPVVESGPARRGPGASGDESPRDAVSRGLRTRPLPIRRGWPAGPSPQLGGARVSERLPRRRTGGGGTRKRGQRSALLRLPAPGGAGLASASPVAARAWGLAARAPWPARRSRGRAPPPRTDCRAVRCARRREAARGRPRAVRMLIKEYHILLPMSLDEYQVAQLYMIQVRAVGSRGPRGALLHYAVRAGAHRPHLGQGSGPSSTSCPVAPLLHPCYGSWTGPEARGEKGPPFGCGGGGGGGGRGCEKGGRRAWWCFPTP